jgi:hypothetical protein
MGVRTVFSSEPCPQHAANTNYPADSQHGDTCVSSGARTVAHHVVVDKGLCTVLKDAGTGPLTVENANCFSGPKVRQHIRAQARKGRKFRIDVTCPPYAMSGSEEPAYRDKQQLIDVSIRHNTTETCITKLNTHQVVGAAAAKGVTDKMVHYAGTYVPAAQQLVPFILESHGRWSDTTKEFMEQVAVHAASRVPCASDQQRKAVKARKLWSYQVIISVALQRAMSITELRYLSKLRSKQRRDVPVLETLWEIHDTPIVEQDVGVLPFSVADVLHGRSMGGDATGQ